MKAYGEVDVYPLVYIYKVELTGEVFEAVFSMWSVPYEILNLWGK
jgi:hypothetical protein